ncbi:MAG TPA: hypothetical protein VN901_06945 [Candidatus Acidoferrales bacterium]|nr:hypothetical protein [Candidatus Acidoferrales bacterium]
MQKLFLLLAPSLLTLIEGVLLAAAVALILFSSKKSSGRDQPPTLLAIERGFGRLARRKRLAVLVVGFSVIAIRVALIPILGVPQPAAHDEFSYLLAADTFAHGKLTNPTPPMWVHFESFHIIQKPTYMSVYPPMQGIVLAAGELLGHPWIGQVFATALMCSALCWMLQGWLPPSWALFGAALAVLRLGILSYWMNGYWSTSIVASGGALVLGAWLRLRKHLRTRDALLMSLGLVILANSRPYEGLVLATVVAFAMLFWLLGKHRPSFRQSVPRVIFPMFFALAIATAATGYYYYRVTGSPFRMTYQVEVETYAAAPFFIWQTPRPETSYHNEVMGDFYRWEVKVFERNRTVTGYPRRAAQYLISWWYFYLGPLLSLPLLALPQVVRESKMRLPLAICAAMVPALAVETWNMPHYFSPATCALWLVVVQGVRHLRHWSPARRPLGTALVRAIPVLACAMILLRVTAAMVHVQIEVAWPRGNLKRATILRQLQHFPSQQLVIVVYDPGHNFDREWVYNDADIDAAKVAWARDMGTDGNQKLLSYFKDRRVWRVNADSASPMLQSYWAAKPPEQLRAVDQRKSESILP